MNTLFFKNKYVRYGLLVAGGVFLGWLFFHSPKTKEEKQHTGETGIATVWTCAMHPQIRMDHPGKCPICGMDLIPLGQQTAETTDPDAIQLTREAAQLANVLTSVVSYQKPVKEIRLYGKVQADERALESQVSHLPGRIEKLMVNFTGETVRKGQPLALIYSPELVTAQQELLEAAKTKQNQPEIYQASIERLRQWKLTDEQISDIETSGTVKDYFQIVANTSGIITGRRVNNGDHVEEGTVLYDVANLSQVWLLFDAYESDLPFINLGDRLTFTIQALPGKTYSGIIAFIDPVIDPVTRVSKVRVEINNESGKLKPEMFATGIIQSDLNEYRNKLIIPASSVLWTGTRSIVYVKQPDIDEPVFKMREIELGPSLGNSYIIESGLKEGEEIVTQGTFSVDASAQLAGKPSMMNQEGGVTNTMPGMDMNGKDKTGQGEMVPQKSDISEKNKEENMSQMSGMTSQTPMEFIMQLGKAVDSYIVLKNALVEGSINEANKAAEKAQQAIAKVNMGLLKGDAHMKWMDISGSLKVQFATIIKSTDIEEQRTAFSAASNQLYKAVKSFGLMKKTLYYQFCPMFNNSKGAYWLSETKEIRNPYYGEAMLTCGETRETLKFQM